MDILIKNMKKPKFCYEMICGEYKTCPFVNADDDCILQLNKGMHGGTWEDQYSRCPFGEAPEPDEASKKLNDLISDINPWEICSQIESDNLSDWCKTIQTEMKMAMVQLPCWAGRRTD